MNVSETLLELEERGWQALSAAGGADFYQHILTDDAVMVLPFGTLERDACVESIRQAPPWASYEIADPKVVMLGHDSGLITYRAEAQRPGEPTYRAMMTSVYVTRGGHWRLALHQQTPLMTA
ncbi:MAG TPA: nuclear transport factor 2 family protein [Streptosporangiaceae bacterium]